LQRGWRQHHKQQQLQNELAVSASLAKECVAVHLIQAIQRALRTSAAIRLQHASRKRALRRARAAVRLQRAFRGDLARCRLADRGVLIASGARFDNHRDITWELRRCLNRDGQHRLKTSEWEFVATLADCTDYGDRTVLRISDADVLVRCEMSRDGRPTPLAITARNRLRHSEFDWCADQLMLQLGSGLPKDCDSSALSDPPDLYDPEPNETVVSSSSSKLPGTSVSWLCDSCGFTNEVSPAVCVLCDAMRSTEVVPSSSTCLPKKSLSAGRPPVPSTPKCSASTNGSSSATGTASMKRACRDHRRVGSQP
jgi:hypothetical protein